MRASVRRLLVALISALVLAAVHEISARIVGRHDLLGAVLNRFDPVTLVLGLSTFVLRAVLYFVVPGWLVYRVVSVFLDRPVSAR